MGTPCFYTNEMLLPQSQSPEQLSAWLSGTHPGYDLVALCIYGSLISQDSNQPSKTEVSAFAYITQFVPSSLLPYLGSIGFRPFQSSFSFDGSKTDGYLISGDASLFPNPAVTMTSNPWSVVVSYPSPGSTQQSTNCVSLIEGTLGAKGAKYMLTADVSYITTSNQQQSNRLRAEIVVVDAMGTVAIGYGPSSFSVEYLTTDQDKDINDESGGVVRDYLKKTNAPMSYQGSYYYSQPLLEVQSFKIVKEDGTVLTEGSHGTLWMDYVVQSFNSQTIASIPASSWHWFIIQFPEKGEALVVCSEQVSSTEITSPPYAMLFDSAASEKLTNGALLPKMQWKMSEICITPDSNSTWTSPNSHDTYYLKYTVLLGPTDSPNVVLTLQAVRDDQEVYLKVGKFKHIAYEGVIEASGMINGESYSGYGWVEISSCAGSGKHTTTQEFEHQPEANNHQPRNNNYCCALS